MGAQQNLSDSADWLRRNPDDPDSEGSKWREDTTIRVRQLASEVRLLGGDQVRERLHRVAQISNGFGEGLKTDRTHLPEISRQLAKAISHVEDAMRAEVVG